MLVGNHSAGKSTLINWYLEENLVDTGVPIETKGFTLITNGNKRQTLKGENAVNMHTPHIRAALDRDPTLLASDRSEFENYFSVKVTTSTAKRSPFVDFIDTPGLVDGNVKYAFNVNHLICTLASVADLIFVFLDPVGQSLCTRTMDAVKALNDLPGVHHKLRYYLTKADTIPNHTQLTKLVVQVTDNMAGRIRDTHGFDIQPIFIPHREADEAESTAGSSAVGGGGGRGGAAAGGLDLATPRFRLDAEGSAGISAEHNCITKLLREIDEAVETKIQSNLVQLKHDSMLVRDRVDKRVATHQLNGRLHSQWTVIQGIFLFLMVTLVSVSFIDVLVDVRDSLPETISQSDVYAALTAKTTAPLGALRIALSRFGAVDLFHRFVAAWLAFAVLGVLYEFLQFRKRTHPLLTAAEEEVLGKFRSDAGAMMELQENMFRQFVDSASKHDFHAAAAASTDRADEPETTLRSRKRP